MIVRSWSGERIVSAAVCGASGRAARTSTPRPVRNASDASPAVVAAEAVKNVVGHLRVRELDGDHGAGAGRGA